MQREQESHGGDDSDGDRLYVGFGPLEESGLSRVLSAQSAALVYEANHYGNGDAHREPGLTESDVCTGQNKIRLS
jgi:hypothetical protein